MTKEDQPFSRVIKEYGEDTPEELARRIIREYGVLIHIGGRLKGSFYKKVPGEEIGQRLNCWLSDATLYPNPLPRINKTIAILRTACKLVINKNQRDFFRNIRRKLGMMR